MKLWNSVVGKLWATIILLVAVVLMILGFFLLEYIDMAFSNSNDVKHLFIYTGVIGFSLTTFFAFFLSTKITQPLVKLRDAAERLTRGDYDARLGYHSSDEIGALANAFDHMADQLQSTVRDLNHEKEHLSSVLRSMTDAVITLDADGRVILTNPQGEKLVQEWSALEWAAGSTTVQNEKRTDEFGTSDGAPVPEPLEGVFRSVVRESTELTDVIQVHQGVWSVVMTPLYTNQQVRGAVAVLRDVTEQHKLNKLRNDFVANVSHELRTPLSMLQGYSEALLDDIADSPEQRRELAQVILDESLRMGRLVHNLLDLARMEAGHLVMKREEVNISNLVKRIVRKFSALAKEHGVELHMELPAQELLIQDADEDRLEQVLTNLTDNALRHTSEGKAITLLAAMAETHEEETEPQLLLEVSDQGEGIPAEDLPYIFERFYKADKARTRGFNGNGAATSTTADDATVGGGTGLGLAIVKNIVDGHGGMIKATSTVGQGTTFSIRLPVSR
ncbi:HAMP domain-containing protein [Xylanibacillus composti]|uniref:histidine kinase n=1 Tax=Xylanibacillus composti TaxID=1572762 RepID=A0A8J4H934_9BACL|nr:ATP-binding protein [Xylanibacillus composti]MDT9725396.1 HAMP domain-containing protein [Xylanibacillus composti]GIQ71453.1 hypothetical protein XYCOK13_42770 [Xylanibacillus composti]